MSVLISFFEDEVSCFVFSTDEDFKNVKAYFTILHYKCTVKLYIFKIFPLYLYHQQLKLTNEYYPTFFLPSFYRIIFLRMRRRFKYRRMRDIRPLRISIRRVARVNRPILLYWIVIQ